MFALFVIEAVPTFVISSPVLILAGKKTQNWHLKGWQRAGLQEAISKCVAQAAHTP
jgi:hypothetical protein